MEDKENIAIKFSVFTFKLAMLGEGTSSWGTEVPDVLDRSLENF